MSRILSPLAVLLPLLLVAPARASEPDRLYLAGSAETVRQGQWVVGLFHPTTVGLLDRVQLSTTLINDLVELARDEMPAHVIESVDLAEVVDHALQRVRRRAPGIVFDAVTEPWIVTGEATSIERAVTNLLTNAIKFTPDGGRITVAVTSDDAERTAQIAVTDTGLGIPEDELENVFAKFFRSTVVQEQAIQGTGLGLAIVKTIVANHDGHIDVRSRPGAGTTFTITLPLTD